MANDNGKLIKEVSMANSIAKRIHLTFPQKNNLPEALSQNVESIRSLNPDFEVILYDDQDVEHFIEKEFGPEVLGLYNRIDANYGAARADLFRYLCIYQCGGVYLDIKAKVTRSLSDSIRSDDRYILSHWNRTTEGGRFENWGLYHGIEHVPNGEFQQWHVIACAGHPFLRRVIQTVIERIDNYSPFRVGAGKNAVYRTTGPIAYTQSIFPLLNNYPHRVVCIEDDFGIHYSIYDRAAGSKHTSHFKSHYAKQIIPLVAGNVVMDRLFYIVQDAIRRLRILRNTLRG